VQFLEMAQEVVNPEEQVYMLCKFQLYKIRLSFWFLYPLPIFVIKLCVCDFKSLSMVGFAPTGAKVTN